MPSSVANCLVVALKRPLKTCDVELYHMSPDESVDGSEVFPVSLMSALVPFAENICLNPAE